MKREDVKVSQNVAAGIAQELRTPVFGIASAAQLIRYRIADDPVMEKNVGRILRETERLNTFIVALLEYGRPSPVRLELADPDEVWANVINSQRGALESKALLMQHSVVTPRVICRIDKQQFAEVCGNVLTNAIEAAAEGSDLSIVSTATAGGAWQSRLSNRGDVIPPDTLARAFEPLVTTKTGHAGIGLATAYRIINDHGGSLALESSDVSGTTVTVSLPLARQS